MLPWGVSLVPQGPLRVLLATLALLLFGLSLAQSSTALTLSAGIGAASLLSLAAWGPRWVPRRAHYLLALAMALPWIAMNPAQDPAQAPFIAKLLIASFGLAMWASFGLRHPKNTRPSAQAWRNILALFGLAALWLAIGCMGGTLASLLWTSPLQSAPLAPNLLLGTTLVAFRHGQFYLTPAKT